MSAKREKRLAVRLDADLHNAAHEKAASIGMTLSKVIRVLLFWWIKNDVDIKKLK